MSFDYHAFDWIKPLSPINFYAVLDVILDIRDALQLKEIAIIPMLQTIVKFGILMPADSITTRDRYCELRWDAAKLLQKRGIIRELDHEDGPHRWESRMKITADLEHIQKLVAAMEAENSERNRKNDTLRQDKDARPAVIEDGLASVLDLIKRFHAVAVQMKVRHEKRQSLVIGDEYDVQDLLHAILLTKFDDVRVEEWTPSYAGKSSRMDFLLKESQMVIETKMTRQTLAESDLGDQLLIDIERYRKYPSLKYLICMIYDPENRIRNPEGLRKDLSGTREGFLVEVVIVPSRI